MACCVSFDTSLCRLYYAPNMVKLANTFKISMAELPGFALCQETAARGMAVSCRPVQAPMSGGYQGGFQRSVFEILSCGGAARGSPRGATHPVTLAPGGNG